MDSWRVSGLEHLACSLSGCLCVLPRASKSRAGSPSSLCGPQKTRRHEHIRLCAWLACRAVTREVTMAVAWLLGAGPVGFRAQRSTNFNMYTPAHRTLHIYIYTNVHISSCSTHVCACILGPLYIKACLNLTSVFPLEEKVELRAQINTVASPHTTAGTRQRE